MTRGPYAKGIAKREEILTTALEVVSERGFDGASVKELADAVGLTPAGLLHYFDSKDDLFVEVLRKRDEVDVDTFASQFEATADDPASAFVTLIRHNAEVPGLVQLFSRMAVAADDPAHPAHAYFVERGAGLRESIGGMIARLQASGRLDDRVPAETLARIVQAVTDGLQLQFLLEPDLDMAAVVEALFALAENEAENGDGSISRR